MSKGMNTMAMKLEPNTPYICTYSPTEVFEVGKEYITDSEGRVSAPPYGKYIHPRSSTFAMLYGPDEEWTVQDLFDEVEKEMKSKENTVQWTDWVVVGPYYPIPNDAQTSELPDGSIAYRTKVKPKIEHVRLYLFTNAAIAYDCDAVSYEYEPDDKTKAVLSYDIVDGEIDWKSMKVETYPSISVSGVVA